MLMSEENVVQGGRKTETMNTHNHPHKGRLRW